MKSQSEIIKELKNLLPAKRFRHSIGVMETAEKLAKIYKADKERACLAGLLHDCSKYMTGNEMIRFLKDRGIDSDADSIASGSGLLHAEVSMFLASENYGVNDPEILSAILCHTLGKEDMSLIDKIIFISDYIEPERDFGSVDKLRKSARKNLDRAIIEAINSTLIHLTKENKIIHPKLLVTRNAILRNVGL